jgi:glyoxylase-like metal-dependent hydrolase (beta-lactamase superfamily II)
MDNIHIIDLHFQDANQTIAAFLIKTAAGPVLIETGPMSTWGWMEKGLASQGLTPADIKHVLLTHIHLDHAGAAWKFAELGAQVYVHPKGRDHLADPSKLMSSATQIYGDSMETLWGDMRAIADDKLTVPEDGATLDFGDVQIIPWFTPGHAVHHIAYQFGDWIFSGDVGGVKINGGPVLPPCPPPDIDLAKWDASMKRIIALRPKGLFLTHYGLVTNVIEHIEALGEALHGWADWMKPHYDSGAPVSAVTNEFMAYTRNAYRELGLSDDDIRLYEYANLSWMSVTGLLRYWRLRAEGRL